MHDSVLQSTELKMFRNEVRKLTENEFAPLV
jgi:hypothetical protein